MTLLILFFTISIILSFLCSIWEAVLLSITPSYVNRQVQEETKVGQLLEDFKRDIDRPLSAILTLNTIAHTVGAIGVGAQAGKIFGSQSLDLIGFHIGFESLIAGLMTLAILILSEIIPKTIGANLWRSLAPFTVRSIRVLIILLLPLVWLSQRITKGLKKDKQRSVLNRADFAAMARIGEESGALQRNESIIIRNLLRLKELTVRDIMTPRTVMAIANQAMTCQEFYDENPNSPFSRIPIFKEIPDEITGMVLKNDILTQVAADNHEVRLEELKIPVSFIEDTVGLPNLIESLSKQRAHLAIVVDDFGSITGLVTMEDLMETLLGIEIMDETDTVADLQKLARAEWQKRAKILGLIE